MLAYASRKELGHTSMGSPVRWWQMYKTPAQGFLLAAPGAILADLQRVQSGLAQFFTQTISTPPHGFRLFVHTAPGLVPVGT